MWGLICTEAILHDSGDLQNQALEKAQYHPEKKKEEQVIHGL